jgi:hypothetical protein
MDFQGRWTLMKIDVMCIQTRGGIFAMLPKLIQHQEQE